jgi:prepilin signal peptidase PulO-like enzyme (type II secretory pathway)
MTYKSIYIFLILGAVLTVVGAFLKITHIDYANLILIIGMGLEVVALFTLIYKVLVKKEENKLSK